MKAGAESGWTPKKKVALDPFHRPLPSSPEEPYLKQHVVITDDLLRDHSGFAVMMAWEKPMMEAHADFVCSTAGGTILNVGFGMGIVDAAIQKRGPHKRHVIVEAHPQVVERAREFAQVKTKFEVPFI